MKKGKKVEYEVIEDDKKVPASGKRALMPIEKL
jgi:hypothetical protein